MLSSFLSLRCIIPVLRYCFIRFGAVKKKKKKKNSEWQPGTGSPNDINSQVVRRHNKYRGCADGNRIT